MNELERIFNKLGMNKKFQYLIFSLLFLLLLNFTSLRLYSPGKWKVLYGAELVALLVLFISFIFYAPLHFKRKYKKLLAHKSYTRLLFFTLWNIVIAVLGIFILVFALIEHTTIIMSAPSIYHGRIDLDSGGRWGNQKYAVFRDGNIRAQISRKEYHKIYNQFGTKNNLLVTIIYLPKSFTNTVLSIKPIE